MKNTKSISEKILQNQEILQSHFNPSENAFSKLTNIMHFYLIGLDESATDSIDIESMKLLTELLNVAHKAEILDAQKQVN